MMKYAYFKPNCALSQVYIIIRTSSIVLVRANSPLNVFLLTTDIKYIHYGIKTAYFKNSCSHSAHNCFQNTEVGEI
jgi:hypothetical protein